MKRLFLFLIFISFGFSAFSQYNELKPDVTTPQRAAYTHLKFQEEAHYNLEWARMALYNPGYSPKKMNELAVQLKQILDARGLYVNTGDMPDDPNYVDSTSGEAIYIPFLSVPEIYLEKINKKWVYSPQTVKMIPEMYADIYPFGTDVVIKMLPQSAHNKFLGVEIWQYVGFLLLIVLSYLLFRALKWFFSFLTTKLIYKFNKSVVAKKFVRPVSGAASMFLVLYIASSLFAILQFPIQVTQFATLFFKILIPAFGSAILYRFVDIIDFYLQKVTQKTKSTLDDQFVPLVKKILKFIVVLLAVIFILNNLNVEVTAIFAGISIGGVAIALAAKDTIANLFGSFTIFVDRPFQIGDWIIFGDMEGTIEEVGIRSTRIRTFYGSLIYIPNGTLANMAIDNMGVRKARRFSTNLGVTYDTPPEIIEVYIEGVRKILNEHPHTKNDATHVYMKNMSSSSLDIMLYTFLEVEDWQKELQSKQEIIFEIIHLADDLGVRFAFPTQTLFVEEMPGQDTLTPKFEEETQVYKQKAKDYNMKFFQSKNRI